MQIKDLLSQATQQLSETSDSARLDAELLLAHCLNKPRSYLFTWPELIPDQTQRSCFHNLLRQRVAGQPVAYLLGEREFWDLTLKVTPATLIPRPETELLVETALQLLQDKPSSRVFEAGTGSGAIAIALAKALPLAKFTACDISQEALQVAQQNAQRYQLPNISFLHSNWFDAVPPDKTFDLVISNPPYIAENDPHLKRGDVRFEPSGALVSGTDGLDDIRHLAHHTRPLLAPGGILMFEHGYDQGDFTIRLMKVAGFHNIRCIRDPAGHNRVTLGYAPL